jgi:hypothetical protein
LFSAGAEGVAADVAGDSVTTPSASTLSTTSAEDGGGTGGGSRRACFGGGTRRGESAAARHDLRSVSSTSRRPRPQAAPPARKDSHASVASMSSPMAYSKMVAAFAKRRLFRSPSAPSAMARAAFSMAFRMYSSR